MDDPLLARARLLIGASGGVGSLPSGSGATELGARKTSPRGGGGGGSREDNSFSVSVVKGSSLVSTKCDLRHVVKRGGVVLIEGQEYTLSVRPHAEWSDRRIELSCDYFGETCLEGKLFVRDYVPRSSPKKKTAEPVSSEEIKSAIRALETIDTLSFSTSRPTNQQQQHHQHRRVPDFPKRRQSLGPDTRPVPAAPPPLYSNDFSGFDAAGGYLASLMQNRLNAEEAQEEQRRHAKLRVEQKKKEDALEVMRKAKEEQDRKASVHAHMELKAKALREKTLLRVSNLQKAKSNEERAKKEAMESELRRKANADALVNSEDYQKRMQRLRLESKQRIKSQKSAEDARKREHDLQMQKKLFEISEQRRRHDHGSIKKLPTDSRRPRSDDGYEIRGEMQRDLIPTEDYGGEYDDQDEYEEGGYYYQRQQKEFPQFTGASPRVSQSADKTNRAAVASAQRYAGEKGAIGGGGGGGGKEEDDDDDDGFWSNDSLGEEEDHRDFSFNDPLQVTQSPPLRRTLRQGTSHRSEQQPEQQQHHQRSVDVSDDDFSAISGITLGSPGKNRQIVANPPKHRTTFKPLKPIPVRAFIPVPPKT